MKDSLKQIFPKELPIYQYFGAIRSHTDTDTDAETQSSTLFFEGGDFSGRGWKRTHIYV